MCLSQHYPKQKYFGTASQILASLLIAFVVLTVTGCTKSDTCTIDRSYNPGFNADNFVAGVGNSLWPLDVGIQTVFTNADERIEVTVTRDTKVIQGVTTTVVRDTVFVNDTIIEDTYDWYAQDNSGNVWYLGEDTKEYENGVVVSTEGSWEAGVDGAKPGIVMHSAQPALKTPYRQEYYACEAEDYAEVISLDESVTVSFGTYTGCLQTREFTPLEPDVNEYKYYCPGVGMVLEVDVATGARTELTAVTTL